MKSSKSRAVDTENKNDITEQPDKDEDVSGVMTRSQLRRLNVEDTVKTKTPQTLKKIQTRKSIVNSVNNSPSKNSAILKDKLTPIKNSRRLQEKGTPSKSSKLNNVKNEKCSVPMADNEQLDHFSKEQLHIDNELTNVPKEKTLPLRRSRKLSDVSHGTETKTYSSESIIVKKGKTSELMNDIEELHHSNADPSQIDKGLINMPKGKATPIRRSRRLSGVVHGTGSYKIAEEGIKEKSSKLNSVKKGETAGVMSDIDEFDVSEDEQSHTGKRSIEIVKEKATHYKCSRKHITDNDETWGEMLNTKSSKLSSRKKRKIAEAQDSNEFNLSKAEQSHLECSDHSIHAEGRTPSKRLTSPKTKKKENTDKSEKEITSPGKKSGFSVSSENSDSDGKDRNKKMDSPRMVDLPPKKKYASYQDLSSNVSEFENRSKSSIKEKVLPKRKYVINSSEDDNDSKKKEKVKFPRKKISFPGNKMASDLTNSSSGSESSNKRTYRNKLSSKDSVSDFDNKNEEESSKEILSNKKVITNLSSEERDSETESNHEKVKPSLKRTSTVKQSLTKLPHKNSSPSNKHEMEESKSSEKRNSIGENRCLTQDSAIEFENDRENEEFSKKKNIIVLSEEEVEEIFLPAKDATSPSKRNVKCKSVMECVRIIPEIKHVNSEKSNSRNVASPKIDEKVTKSVTKYNFQDKITANKILNNIVEKENISSSEALQLPSGCKQVSPSPVFKNRVGEDIKSESSDSDSDAESRKAIMESAQKRIIQNLSTSESESKKFVKPLKKIVDEPSDSDSAPEQMSFSTGRQLEKDLLKNAVESINREKQRKKERRKQRLEKYKQQKEEKLIRLKEKRASQEDASCSSSEESGYEEDDTATVSKSNKIQHVRQEKENLDDLPKTKVKKFHYSDDSDEIKEKKEKKEKKRKHEQNEVQSVGNLQRLPTDVLEKLPEEFPLKLPKFDAEETSKEKRKSKKCENVKEKMQDFRHHTDVDYIPLSSQSSTEFGVMPLEILARAPKSMAERAVEFRQKMLYGSHIKRGPANATAIYQQKLKAAGRDRFVR